MAKGKVKCTCKSCGKTFIRTKKCANRKEANNWELWTQQHIELCPECWKKQQKVNSDHQLKADIVSDFDGNTITVTVEGDTFPIKEELKQAGMRWHTDPVGAGGYWYATFYLVNYETLSEDELDILKAVKKDAEMTTIQAALNVFSLYANQCIVDLNDLVAQLPERLAINDKTGLIGKESYSIPDNISTNDFLSWLKGKAIRERLRRNKPKKPDKPEWLAGKYWNETIYGKNQDVIYLDNEKIILTIGQQDELHSYIERMVQWEEGNEKILK